MTYAKVINNEIKEINNLRLLLPNISNPENLSEDKLKELNVYKVINDTNKLENWQYLENIEYVFDGDKVYEKKIIKDKTLDEFKQEKINEIKKIAKEYIYNLYPEYKQTNALLTLINPDEGIYTIEEATSIRDECKRLIGIARIVEDYIINATTYEEIDSAYYYKNIYDEKGNIIDIKLWGE